MAQRWKQELFAIDSQVHEGQDDGSATESETSAAAPGSCGAPNRNTAMLSVGDLVAEREVKGALTMVSWRLISL